MSRWKIVCVLGLATVFVCALVVALRSQRQMVEDLRAQDASASSAGASARATLSGVGERTRARISGQIFGAHAGRVAGATVCLMCGHCDLVRAPEPARCVRSDQTGAYQLSDVVAGSYRLSATANGYTPSTWQNGKPFELQATDLKEQNIELVPGGAVVSGIVVDATGGVVSAATVRLNFGDNWMAARDALVLETETNDSGEFVLHAPEGTVGLKAEAEGYAGAALLVYAPARDVRLVVTPAARISGTVLDRDRHKPIANIVVTARSDYWEVRGHSDAAGSFKLEGLRPGIYDVRASGARWIGRASNTVTVDLGETVEGVQVYVTQGIRVAGVFRVGDQPCRAGSLHLEPLAGEAGPKLVTQVKPEGAIEFEAVPPGRYQTYMFCNDYGTKRGEILAVSGADILGQSWRMERGATVNVHVLSPERKPVAGAWVQLVRESATQPSDPAQLAPKQLQSDESGVAHFVGVLPTDYAIRGPQLEVSQPLHVSERDTALEATITLRPVQR